MPEGYSRVLEAPKSIFWRGYGMLLSIFLFLSELGTCPQISYREEVWNIVEKFIFRNGVCWNSHTKAGFWQKNKAYEKSTPTSPHKYCSLEIEFS
jgi:hypothetical protein